MPKAAKNTVAKSNRKTSSKQKADIVKKKAKKDSSEPKRNLTAYMFFSKDYREKVREEHPKATFGEFD